ncbi:MAG: type II methionyl aminopeptidase [Candidatus Lokiarchaeota archaeon]|nr:type II methionyl aminopeptidase [Candidatus Lokiarchaeota archaeon]
MNDEIIQSYLKAGKAVAKALHLAKLIVRPGAKFFDIATLCEGEILKQGCGLAFPANMSLDAIAAHYSPILEDETKVPEHGLLKIDCGAEYDGYIADAAVTVNIGGDKGIYEDLVTASEEALNAAIRTARDGIKVTDIGKEIYKTIMKYNVKPIANLGGHGLGQFEIHDPPFIPNTPKGADNSQLIADHVYAIEPFTTNGYGQVKNGEETNIFEVGNTKKKNMKIEERALVQKFKSKFNSLPFSPRAVDFIEGTSNINSVIDKFRRKGILNGYPILVEIAGGMVAQTEHTIIVFNDKVHVTTTLDNDL